MKKVSLLLAALICLLLVPSRADEKTAEKSVSKPAAPETEEFSHDGVWKPRGAMLGGALLPPQDLKTITLKITGNRYEVTVEGEAKTDKGTFTVDKTVTPKRMTIKGTSGPNEGKTILAIYEFKNADTMRVCYDLSGQEFPSEFKAPKDTKRYLVGYRRAAEKEE